MTLVLQIMNVKDAERLYVNQKGPKREQFQDIIVSTIVVEMVWFPCHY